jgi:hypothetical protein
MSPNSNPAFLAGQPILLFPDMESFDDLSIMLWDHEPGLGATNSCGSWKARYPKNGERIGTMNPI